MENEIVELVFDTLCKNSGHLYVCGDVKMANDVENTLKKIFVKEGEMEEEEAEKWIQEMKVINRTIVQILFIKSGLGLSL